MTATDLNMRLTIARGVNNDTHPDDAAAAEAHNAALTPGRRVWWHHPRTNQIIHGTITSRRRGSIEVFIHADGQEPGKHWTLPTYVLHLDTPRARVWWPERTHITGDDGYTTTVAIGVDGHATCTCGADSPVTDTDACEHISEARTRQDDPWRDAFHQIRETWIADEAWRDNTARRAETGLKLVQLVNDAEARIRLHEEAKERLTQTPTVTEAIDRFGDAA